MRADMRGHDIAEQPSRVRRAGLGGRRPAAGPRPARPGVVPVGVRPLQPARPAGAPRPVALAGLASSFGSGLLGTGLLRPVRRAEQRVLARRRPAAGPVRIAPRSRGALIVGALVAATATCVVLLGLLADAVSEARSGATVAPTVASAAAPAQIAASETGAALAFAAPSTASSAATVTVGSEETVWEVAQEIAPAASGSDVAALAERLVTANGLSSVRVHPGQVLRVTTR
jgi:LysM repeat protein